MGSTFEEEEAEAHVISVDTDTDSFVLHGRPCELSSQSFVPPHRNGASIRNYFNVPKEERYSNFGYDVIFHQNPEYNQHLHRDDREHAKSRGLQVNKEEKSKPVNTLSSSIYGKRLHNVIDPPERQHVRIGVVQEEFYRRNGTGVNN